MNIWLNVTFLFMSYGSYAFSINHPHKLVICSMGILCPSCEVFFHLCVVRDKCSLDL